MLIAQQDEPDVDPASEISSEIDNQLTVVLDRWSLGQLGWPDLVAALVFVAFAALLAYLVRRVIRRSTQEVDGPTATALSLVGQLISLGIYAFALAIALDMLGFTAGPVLVVLVLALVLVLVFRPLIVNLGSGLFLQLRGYCRPGDVVTIEGETGVVDEVNARSVILETIDGRTVIIANERAMSETIVNYSRLGKRRSHITLRLAPDADLAEVTALVESSLAGLESVAAEPPPRLMATGFDGPQIWAEIHYWTAPEPTTEIRARDEVTRALSSLFQSGPAPADSSSVVHLMTP